MFRILTLLTMFPFLLNSALGFQPPQQPAAAVPKSRPIFYQQRVASKPAAPQTTTTVTQVAATAPVVAQPTGSNTECQCEYCKSQRRQAAVGQQQLVHANAATTIPGQTQPTPLLSQLNQVSHTQTELSPTPEYISADAGEILYGDTFGTCSTCPTDSYCGFEQQSCGYDSERWLSLESLVWWTNGSSTPALATISQDGTLQSNAGILGFPTTSTVFGDNDLFEGSTPGFRIRGGKLLDDGCTGIDIEFFMLAEQHENFLMASSGNPILTRPFRDTLTGQQNSELVGYPGVATGQLRFHGQSRLYSAAAHLYRLAEEEKDCCDEGGQFSAMVQVGPRFASLRDSLFLEEYVTGSQGGVQNILIDSFRTENAFLGGELGLKLQHQTDKMFLRGNLGIALGVTRQELEVYGSTTRITGQGATTQFPGGLLAQRTNSGSFSRNRFSVMPQAELKIGFATRWGWEITAGYNIFYWSKVLRATEQIDPSLNPNLLPPEVVPFTGSQQPTTLLKESGYLAHGISFGLEKRF